MREQLSKVLSSFRAAIVVVVVVIAVTFFAVFSLAAVVAVATNCSLLPKAVS